VTRGDQALAEAAVRRFLSAPVRSPLGTLTRDAHRFEFFQAVRLIGLVATEGRIDADGPQLSNPSPYEEHLRFRTQVSLAFPAGTVSACTVSVEDGPPPERARVPLMTVSFLGLAGTGGILPWHYTQLLVDAVREKDFRLRDFLDLLNHRAIAQFYRAWQKSHFYIEFETSRRAGSKQPDRFTQMLLGLVGMGTPGLRRRQAVDDDVFVYYAAHFSHRPRSAVALQQMISDLFQVPAEIEQFRGQWLNLRLQDQTRLQPNENDQLGVSVVAGTRVWSIEHGIRVRLRVSRHALFRQFLPGAPGYASVGDLVRSFVGPVCDLDLQIVLTKEEVPQCQLTADGSVQLGWETWLFSSGATRDVDDAVFPCDGMPRGVQRDVWG
jgi:type VI secretion system protein ImpH